MNRLFMPVALALSVAFVSSAFGQCQSQQQAQISALDLQLLQRSTPAMRAPVYDEEATREQIESAVRDAIDNMLQADDTSAMIRSGIRSRIQSVQQSPSDKECYGDCVDGQCDLKDSLVAVPIKTRVTKKSFSVFLTKFRRVENHYVGR